MRSGRIFWGSIVIMLGMLLLLENLGFFESLGFSVWGLFWPTAIILIGLWFLWGAIYGRGSALIDEIAIPREGTQVSRITLKYGAGRLLVKTGSQLENILEGKFVGGLDYDNNRDNDRSDLVLRVPSGSFPWMPGIQQGFDWDVVLNPEIRYSLQVTSGANETRLLLGEALVDELILETGASSTYVELSKRTEQTRVKVSSGVASIEIKVPEGVAARIRSSSGLTTLNVNQNRFPQRGSVYESTDYETATRRVEFDLESGLASISIL